MAGFDLSKIKINKRTRQKECDPLKIFDSLTLRGSIENLWGPQVDALSTWYDRGDETDLVVEMNTGGGKTVVGLLLAQSLVQETGQHVLVVCPTKQLIEQSAHQAGELGLEVATYMSGEWVGKEISDEGRGPCITNYDAVFNGKSIFTRYELGGLVLDDAHVAGSIIRSQFTLSIDQQDPLYDQIINVVQGYFIKNSQEQRLESAKSGDPNALLYLPMYEWRRCVKQVAKLLVTARVDEKKKWLFTWEHIKDHLDRCVLLISGSRMEISPPVLPLHKLPCLSSAKKRTYLTATVPSPTEFVKTFGTTPKNIISPKGKLGEAQRLILFSPGEDNQEQRQNAKTTIAAHKACIIVPSGHAADEWSDVGHKFERGQEHSEIEEFKSAEDESKLILVARYDGVDLPGDSCRVLVVDGLPRGSSLMNRFIDEGLQILSLRASHTAVRLVQAVGRIFRSNTDHGTVIFCGNDLISWARSPAHLRFLPPLLQRQLQLGLELNNNIRGGNTTAVELIDAVLSGEKSWDEFYQSNIQQFETDPSASEESWLPDCCLKEQAAYQCLWEGNYHEAAKLFGETGDLANLNDRKLGAWYLHWQGLALDMAGDRINAAELYIAAANVRAELGRPEVDSSNVFKASHAPEPGAQAVAIATIMSKRKAKCVADIEKIQEDLCYGPNTKPTEEALKQLGRYLGLKSTRPDTAAEENTGPDVLWRHEDSKTGAALEAKTDKKENSHFRKKDDIGQFHDHKEFLSQKYPGESFYETIIGKELPVSSECHPPEKLVIIDLNHFKSLTEKVMQLYTSAASDNGSEGSEVVIQRWLNHLGLNWPEVIESLPSRLASDLQVTDRS